MPRYIPPHQGACYGHRPWGIGHPHRGTWTRTGVCATRTAANAPCARGKSGCIGACAGMCGQGYMGYIGCAGYMGYAGCAGRCGCRGISGVRTEGGADHDPGPRTQDPGPRTQGPGPWDMANGPWDSQRLVNPSLYSSQELRGRGRSETLRSENVRGRLGAGPGISWEPPHFPGPPSTQHPAPSTQHPELLGQKSQNNSHALSTLPLTEAPTLHAACCMLHAACSMLHAACCMLRGP